MPSTRFRNNLERYLQSFRFRCSRNAMRKRLRVGCPETSFPVYWSLDKFQFPNTVSRLYNPLARRKRQRFLFIYTDAPWRLWAFRLQRVESNARRICSFCTERSTDFGFTLLLCIRRGHSRSVETRRDWRKRISPYELSRKSCLFQRPNDSTCWFRRTC